MIPTPYACRTSRGFEEVYHTGTMKTVIDCIPTPTAAENIAREMNRAFLAGYYASQHDIKSALGL